MLIGERILLLRMNLALDDGLAKGSETTHEPSGGIVKLPASCAPTCATEYIPSHILCVLLLIE